MILSQIVCGNSRKFHPPWERGPINLLGESRCAEEIPWWRRRVPPASAHSTNVETRIILPSLLKKRVSSTALQNRRNAENMIGTSGEESDKIIYSIMKDTCDRRHRSSDQPGNLIFSIIKESIPVFSGGGGGGTPRSARQTPSLQKERDKSPRKGGRSKRSQQER